MFYELIRKKRNEWLQSTDCTSAQKDAPWHSDYYMKKFAYSLVLCFCACTWGFVQPVQAQLYKDSSRTAEERAADLLVAQNICKQIA